MSATLLAKLIEAGTPAELVGEVAMELARAQAAQEQTERRKAKDRERKRNSTDSAESAESQEIPSPLEVSPQTPLPKTPNPVGSPLSPPAVVLAEKKQAIACCLRVAYPCPEGVSDEQWAAFRDQRKKKLNPRSYLLLCNKLIALAEDGWPPGEMIDLAIERGWETVFKPKDQPNVVSLQRNRPNLTALLRASSSDPESGLGTRPALPASGNG